MEIAYKYNKAKTFYQEVNSIRQGFKPQTLLIQMRKVTHEATIQESYKGGLNITISTLNCKMEQ